MSIQCAIHKQDPNHHSSLSRYLIHAPFFSEKKEDHQAKWKQMEQLKAAGLARSIGVSNYLPEHLDWLLETASTPPSINQIEFHPYLQHAGLVDYHKKHVRQAKPPRPNQRSFRFNNIMESGSLTLTLRHRASPSPPTVPKPP